MAAAGLVAPRLAQIVRVVGRPDAPVRFLRFEGLTLAHTEWQPPADWAASSQAAVDVPGALSLTHATRCAIRRRARWMSSRSITWARAVKPPP